MHESILGSVLRSAVGMASVPDSGQIRLETNQNVILARVNSRLTDVASPVLGIQRKGRKLLRLRILAQFEIGLGVSLLLV
jgi:hypothetical protein